MNLKRVFWSSITACVVLTLLILSAGLASAFFTDGVYDLKFNDSFIRADNAAVGNGWTEYSGTGFDINGSRLRASITGTDNRINHSIGIGVNYFNFSINKTTTGTDTYVGLRNASSGGEYILQLVFTTAGKIDVRNVTTVDIWGQYTTNTVYHVEVWINDTDKNVTIFINGVNLNVSKSTKVFKHNAAQNYQFDVMDVGTSTDYIYFVGAGNFTITPLGPSVTYNAPVNHSANWVYGSPQVSVSATLNNLGAVLTAFNTWLYNSSGSLLNSYYLQLPTNNYTINLSSLAVGNYYINSTAYNFTEINVTDKSGYNRTLVVESYNSTLEKQIVVNTTNGETVAWFTGTGARFSTRYTPNYNDISFELCINFTALSNDTISSSSASYLMASYPGAAPQVSLEFNRNSKRIGFITRNSSVTRTSVSPPLSYNINYYYCGAANTTDQWVINKANNTLENIVSRAGGNISSSFFALHIGGSPRNETATNAPFNGTVNFAYLILNGTVQGNWTFDEVNYPYFSSSGVLNFSVYNVTNGSITNPINGSSVSSQYLNVTWTNITFTPTGTTVSGTNFTLSFLNSTRGLIREINKTNLLYYYWNVYNENQSTGTYYLRVTAYDNQSNSVNYTDHQINITTNALLNLTARSAVYNNTITIFNASIVGGNINTTLGTTTGLIQIDIVKNVAYNVTIFYTNITTNSTLYSTNLTHNQINYTLYWLNSLNIYFYDESTLTLLNNNTVISLDLISDDYSSNYTVINGSIQINLLTPETYVSRYSSTGYTERFYVFTVTNDTYQILNLYLRNDTDAVLVQVKNAALQVVEGAVVKAQKKIPATNEHITVEIGQTDSNGEILMSLSLNDEFYRFIVSVDDVIKLTTNDAYIIDEIVPLYLPQEGATGEEPFQYLAIDHTLTFSTSNNRFLFSFNDGNNLQKDYCIKVRTQTGTYNTSCQTDVDAGSMSIYVTPVNGTTYVATTYVYFGESEIPLGTLSYAFQENPFEGNSTQIQETNKLLVLIQVIISIIFIYAAMQTMPELIPLAFGISLILGRVMLLTQFEWWIINAVAFACLVLSAWLGVKKDG